MPITPRSHEARSFVRPAYEPDTRTLLELMRMAGASRSQAIGRKGEAKAQGLMTLGQIIGGVLGQQRMGRERQQLAEMEMADKQAARNENDTFRRDQLAALTEEREAGRQFREEAAAQAQRDRAEKAAIRFGAETMPGPISEQGLDTASADPATFERTRYSFGPGTAQGPELMPTPQQAEMAKFRQQIEGRGGMVSPTGSAVMPPTPPRDAQPTEASFADRAANGDRAAARALEILRRQRATPPLSDNQPLMSVMGPDGLPVYVPRSQAAGMRPASTREQGRPVVSGDANRIADLDTSLDDVAVLDGVLSGVSGSTGTSAKVGAMLPNWVTELTGRGISAKQKQATIDRVKQVIGKALEGGVLRKEDELKYEKILPTIYDNPQVVTTKLAGLKTALTQRRQTLIDALADAGYDTSRFNERGAVKPVPSHGPADDRVNALIKKYGGG